MKRNFFLECGHIKLELDLRCSIKSSISYVVNLVNLPNRFNPILITALAVLGDQLDKKKKEKRFPLNYQGKIFEAIIYIIIKVGPAHVKKNYILNIKANISSIEANNAKITLIFDLVLVAQTVTQASWGGNKGG